MRLRSTVLLACFIFVFLFGIQVARTQDVMKFLTGSEFSPEQQKALLQSRQFKTITPEEIEKGKAELERQEKAGQLEEQKRIENEKKEEKEAKKIAEISNQEKELRYIFNKYKDMSIRNVLLILEQQEGDDSVELKLLDSLDQYEEDVIRDTTDRFQLRSALYRDSSKRVRNIFVENKREAVAKIQEIRLSARDEQAQVSREDVGDVFQSMIDRIIKEMLDNFTLKWAFKDTLLAYEEELPYAKPVDELQLFGHELFSRPSETFAPPTSMPVTEDYLVGPGDEIKVLMWGRIDADYSLVVSRDGTIQFPRIGTVTVAGMTYKEMKKHLKKEAESITGVNISLTMGRLRSITVFVVGEIKRPGAYTVSAFDTVINALLLSGGPTELGSLRNVQLKRKDKIVTSVDFYEFLLQGETSKDRRLKPGDVVFVPEAKTLVVVAGNVKRPAIYELRGDRSLNTLIDLAGGLAPGASKQRLQIERSYEHQKQLVLDVTFEGSKATRDFNLQDGDVVKVFPIAPDKVDAVYLYGNVLRPGSHSYRLGMRVSDLIRDETELRSDTDFSYALIKRYVEPDMHVELIPFNLGRAILTRSRESNIKLNPYDEIYVFNKWLFSYKPYVSIKGEVRKPETYSLAENMKIKDLVIAAGGLDREAYLGESHLFRTDPETKNVTLIKFNLERVLNDDSRNNLPLQDQDEVVIHSIREYKPREAVSIYGMVNNPGQYPLAEGMTIKDLIMAGGNLRKEAFKEEAELVRFELVNGELMKTEVFPFNLTAAITGDPNNNLKLQDYDRIFIKRIPKWLDEMRVSIEGEVTYSGDYYVRDNERLSSLIERAGGFTKDAYLRGAFFTRESVRQIQRQRLDELISRMEQEITAETGLEATGAMSPEEVQAFRLSLEAKRALLQRLRQARVTGRLVIQLAALEVFKDSKFDLRLEDGDRLVIPKEPENVNVLGEVYNSTSFLYVQGKKANFYLGRAGGPTTNADKSEMYIIRVDGTVVSRSQSGSSYTWDPETNRWVSGSFATAEIYRGDSVLVPRKLVKIHWIKEAKDITQIMFQIAVVVGVIAAL